jgi:hypothetical protein
VAAPAPPSSAVVKKPARGVRGAPLPAGQNTASLPQGSDVALVAAPAQKKPAAQAPAHAAAPSSAAYRPAGQGDGCGAPLPQKCPAGQRARAAQVEAGPPPPSAAAPQKKPAPSGAGAALPAAQ